MSTSSGVAMSIPKGKWRLFKRSAKRKVESVLSANIVAKGRPSHGICLYDDLSRFGFRLNTILDVGANVGQFASQALEKCPNASLHCFEPEHNAYTELNNNITNEAATLSNFALGEKPATAVFYVTGDTGNSFIRPAETKYETTVQVSTVDEYIATHSIQEICLLKIDTEGFEIQVLKGAIESLAAGKISAILAEVGFDPNDTRHVPIEAVRDFLIPYGFRIMGL